MCVFVGATGLSVRDAMDETVVMTLWEGTL